MYYENRTGKSISTDRMTHIMNRKERRDYDKYLPNTYDTRCPICAKRTEFFVDDAGDVRCLVCKCLLGHTTKHKRTYISSTTAYDIFHGQEEAPINANID